MGLPGALAVATGVLAVPGLVLGLFASICAVSGIAATRRKHVTGTTNGVLGLALGLAALSIGILAATGSLTWLDLKTDTLTGLLEWIDRHASWLTPGV